MDRIPQSSTSPRNCTQPSSSNSTVSQLNFNSKDEIIIHACTKINEFNNADNTIKERTRETFKTEIRGCFNELSKEKGYFTLGHTRSTVYLATLLYHSRESKKPNNIQDVYNLVNGEFGTNLGSDIWFTYKNTQYLNEIYDAIEQSVIQNNNQTSLLPKEQIIKSSGGEVHNLQNIINALVNHPTTRSTSPINIIVESLLMPLVKIGIKQIILDNTLGDKIYTLSIQNKLSTDVIWSKLVSQLFQNDLYKNNDNLQLAISCSINNHELCEITKATAESGVSIGFLEINGDNLLSPAAESVSSKFGREDAPPAATRDQLQNAFIQLKQACPELGVVEFTGNSVAFERDIIVSGVRVGRYDKEPVKCATFKQVLQNNNPDRIFPLANYHHVTKEYWREAVLSAGGNMDMFNNIDTKDQIVYKNTIKDACKFEQILACYPESYNDPEWTSHSVIPSRPFSNTI